MVFSSALEFECRKPKGMLGHFASKRRSLVILWFDPLLGRRFITSGSLAHQISRARARPFFQGGGVPPNVKTGPATSG